MKVENFLSVPVSDDNDRTHCWPFCHKWTKWQDSEKGTLRSQITTYAVGYFIQQERRCKTCNKVQLRIETVG